MTETMIRTEVVTETMTVTGILTDTMRVTETRDNDSDKEQ